MNITSTLNNREIATAIWLIIFLLWALSISGVRRAIPDLLRAFFNAKIFVPFVAMLLYIFAMIITLKRIGFWDISAIKDTILWITGTAFTVFFNLNKAIEDDRFFKNFVIDNIKLIVLLEFVVNFYSFSLVAELLIIPIVSLIAIMIAVTETKPKYQQLKTPLGYVLGIFGLCIIAFTVHELIMDFWNFTTLKNLRDFVLPPLFSMIFLPFAYLMTLLMQYDSFFTRIDIANKKSDIAKYAKRKVVLVCHFNLSRLNQVSKIARFPKVSSKDDVLNWFIKAND